MPRFIIDRCRCAGLDFAALVELAREGGLDAARLAERTGAGRRCKHCRPWLRRALAGEGPRFELDSGSEPDGAALLRHFQPETGA